MGWHFQKTQQESHMLVKGLYLLLLVISRPSRFFSFLAFSFWQLYCVLVQEQSAKMMLLGVSICLGALKRINLCFLTSDAIKDLLQLVTMWLLWVPHQGLLTQRIHHRHQMSGLRCLASMAETYYLNSLPQLRNRPLCDTGNYFYVSKHACVTDS